MRHTSSSVKSWPAPRQWGGQEYQLNSVAYCCNVHFARSRARPSSAISKELGAGSKESRGIALYAPFTLLHTYSRRGPKDFFRRSRDTTMCQPIDKLPSAADSPAPATGTPVRRALSAPQRLCERPKAKTSALDQNDKIGQNNRRYCPSTGALHAVYRAILRVRTRQNQTVLSPRIEFSLKVTVASSSQPTTYQPAQNTPPDKTRKSSKRQRQLSSGVANR